MNDLLVLVTIDGRHCALPADDVNSVIEIGTIVPIPRAPEQVLGMTALRSQALTVIDCRTVIGCDADSDATDERAAVVKVGGHGYALLVDTIQDVATPASEIKQLPGGFGEGWARVSRGMVETASGPVLLLDIARLVDPRDATRRAA